MAEKEKRIKVVLTPAGSEWSEEREYERLDYISNGKEVWVSVKVDAATGKNVGHPLTDTAWWNKCIDLSEATAAANKAITLANNAVKTATDTKDAVDGIATIAYGNEADIAYLWQRLDMFGDAFVGFARVSGDADPKPGKNLIYGDRKLVREIGKHMKLGTVKRVGNEAVLQHECAPGRITKASNGEDVAVDGSEGDLLAYIDMPLYMIKANQASGKNELSCMGVGVVPCYWLEHAAKKIEPFAISPFYTVSAQLEGDESKCAHCVINDSIKGMGTFPNGALKEKFGDMNSYGYYVDNNTGLGSISDAQSKNADPKTNYPYMGGYYEFFELWLMMMYVECGTLDTHDIYCMGVGCTQAAAITEATWCNEKIAANSGVKLFKADGSCVGYGSTNANLLKYKSDKQDVSGLKALVGGDRYPYTKCGETLTVLDGITKAGLQDKIGKASSVFYTDADGNMVCSEDGSVNVTTGEGMEANKRYYIVRDVPNCQGLGNGVMTAVVNCYLKMHFSDGVATNDVDLTGGYILYKFSHSVYRGFCIPMDGTLIQLAGAYYTTSKKNGAEVNKFYCAEKWQDIYPLKSWTSYTDIEYAETLDILKGLSKVRVVSGNQGAVGKADYSYSLFCFSEMSGSMHSKECCFTWNNGYMWGGGNGGKAEEGKLGVKNLAIGCASNSGNASARSARCNEYVSSGVCCGTFAAPQLKFKP